MKLLTSRLHLQALVGLGAGHFCCQPAADYRWHNRLDYRIGVSRCLVLSGLSCTKDWMNRNRDILNKITERISLGCCFFQVVSNDRITNQYNRYVSRGVYTSDMLVQWLDGSVAVVVCDGENQHISICPVDWPAGPVIIVEVSIVHCVYFKFIFVCFQSYLLICSWQYRPSASSCKTHSNIL